MKHIGKIIRNLVMLVFIVCFLFTPGKVFSRGLPENDSVTIDEKVYLHTDRDVYFPGDDLWFSAYLIDATFGLLTSNSTNLHVELLSSSGEQSASGIVRLSGGLGSGDFHLTDTLKPGDYTLRAYTNYMRNVGEDSFFVKKITVVNASGSEIESHAISKQSDSNPDISYFPEGGSLVNGVVSVVAFKAGFPSGAGCNVTGDVFNSAGQQITSFKSVHKGMGTFSFQPVYGQDYYSVAMSGRGDTIRKLLPRCFRTGVVMNVIRNGKGELSLAFRTNDETFEILKGSELSLSVSKGGNTLKSYTFIMKSLNSLINIPSIDLPDGILRLTLSGSGEVPVCERLVFISNNENVKLNVETDRGGYNLRDSVSVRITYADSSASDNDCNLSLSASDKDFTAISSSCTSSIASWFLLESDIRGEVEDPGYYFDLSNKNRLTDLDFLLLTHGWRDFKWKYEGIRFLPEHGFTISGRVRKKFSDTPVKNCWVSIGIFKEGNPLVKIIPVSSEGRFSIGKLDIRGVAKVIATVSDDNDKLKGWLLIDSLNYKPAGTAITAKSVIPDIGTDLSVNDSPGSNNLKRRYTDYSDIRSSLNMKYKLSDTIAPGEVMITARRDDAYESARSRSKRYLMGIPDKEIVITPELKATGNVLQLISSRYMRKRVLPVFGLNFGMSVPVFMIDGVRVSVDEVKSIPIDWVERIDIIDNPAATLIRAVVQVNDSTTTMSDGVVSIILKSNSELDNMPEFHSVNFSVKGYDEPRIFFSPRHKVSLETDYKPDVRTTLFWKPDIKLVKGSEQILNFYNGDNQCLVRIVASGITGSGVPVSASAEYEVR